MATAKFYGTGRRKKSIARVYLVPGTGKITINKRDIDEYLGLETLKVVVRQPLVATETVDKFDVLVNVRGGGYTGQAGAIRHGIARALLEADSDYRPVLKKAGYLTRDPRMKERKKNVNLEQCGCGKDEVFSSSFSKIQTSETLCFWGFLSVYIESPPVSAYNKRQCVKK